MSQPTTAQDRVRPQGCQWTGRAADREAIEYGVLWPDGTVRPLHPNEHPLFGDKPIYAYRGCRFVQRTVTFGEWADV